MAEFKHIPVLHNECMEGLAVKEGGLYFDGTLGGAGHSESILRLSSPNGRLYATDLDKEAIAAADNRLSGYSGRYTLISGNFKNFKNIALNYSLKDFDGILLDLGISSYQIDNKQRGFSYMAEEALLDMRMDQSASFTAIDIVNSYSEAGLIKILREYGEEKFAASITRGILKVRKSAKIETVGQLNTIIDAAIPKKFRLTGHSAKKTYQALRIEVNSELSGLYEAVTDMVYALKPGGRIAIISFHSLEDRIIKQAFSYLATDCVCSKELPVCICGKRSEIKLINKKPIEACEEEQKNNPRSKSAKLRIAERI